MEDNTKSKSEIIELLRGEIEDLRNELRSSKIKLSSLIDRIILKVIEESQEENYCVDGQIIFLKSVLDGFANADYIEGFFSRDYELSVTFTVKGADDPEINWVLGEADIAELLETGLDSGSVSILSHYISEC